MPAPVLSERDLGVLRTFARRIDPSDAGAHNNLGVLYYQKGLVAEAIAEFGRALELDPRMQVAQTNLEIAYRSSGYYDRRVSELREVLRRQPAHRDARWELARTYAAMGQSDEAIREFHTLVEQYPQDVPSLIQLGLAEKASGRPEEACDHFQRASELDPESSVALFYYGEALYNRGLPDQARAVLQEAVALNPDNADAHYLLAFLYGDLGYHEAARAATKRAIALNPTLARAHTNLSLQQLGGNGTAPPAEAPARPSVAEGATLAHFNLGLAFRQKGYYTEALREYRMALEQGEDRRLTLQAMAEVHLLRRDLGGALDLYQELVQEYTDSPKLQNELGVCLHQAGRRDEAEAAYRQAVRLDRNYALAWNNLGVLQSRYGLENEDAVESFQQALRCRRDLTAGRLNLGLLLFQRRRFQLALEAYRQVLGEEPRNAVAWNGVGLVLTELKRFPDARNAFVRAVEADPRNASAHYNLSFTLSQLGDYDGALRETKQALELEPYYVPQKFSLAIDLQYEDPTIAVVPEISADIRTEQMGEDFAFDQRLLDQFFKELSPAAVAAEPAGGDDPLALAREYIQKGLLERAAGELDRARTRGAAEGKALVLHGHIYARRGLHGEALERYRQAGTLLGGDEEALLGEVRSLLALDRAGEAGTLAEELVERRPEDVDVLVAAAQTRLHAGNPVGALDLVKEAQARAPGRPDLLQLQARVNERLGQLDAAAEAYHGALQLDGTLAQVWYELGQLEERRERWSAARQCYEHAVDLLPSYVEAVLGLADLLRRTESPSAAVDVLVALLTTEPLDLDALTLLGRALLDDQRMVEALEAFRRVLRFDPDNPGALYFAGMTLGRLRRFQEAVQLWDRVIQQAPGSSFAQLARNETRSARELQHIFSRRRA